MAIILDTSYFKTDWSPYWKVADRYDLNYDREQAMYEALAEKLGALSSAVEGTTKAKDIYDRYNDRLMNASGRFGLAMNVDTRRELNELKKMYGLDIKKLEVAREKMLENVKMLLAAYQKDPTLFQENVGNLDKYLSNPTFTPRAYSGQTLMADVVNLAKALAKASQEIRPGKDLDAFTKTYSKLTGMRYDVVANAINELRTTGNITNSTLWNMVDSAVSTSGMKDWATTELLKRAYEWAGKGLASAIGEEQVGTYANEAAKMQAQYDYAVKLKQKEAEIAANAAALTARGNLAPGTTNDLHFTNSETAASSMKQVMAQKTLLVIKANEKSDANAKKIIDYWKSKVKGTKQSWEQAALEHWSTNGFNGEWVTNDNGKPSYLYYQIGNAIRKDITKNENLINTWRSPYANYTSNNGNSRLNVYSIEELSAPMRGGLIQNLPSASTSAAKQKNWNQFGDFAEQSTKAYTTKITLLYDDRNLLNSWLNRVFSYITNDELIKLYDIKSVSPTGKYTYSQSGTKFKDMPQTKDGDIDVSRIHRAQLANGDFLLTWQKDGKLVLKVLKLSDIGDTYTLTNASHNYGAQSIINLYNLGLITKDLQDAYLRLLKQAELWSDYGLGQEANVKDYDIK